MTLSYVLWALLVFGIVGVAFCVAHISQRQVIVASGPAFQRMRRYNQQHAGLLDIQRCFMWGRSVTIITFLAVCACVCAGIGVLVTSDRQNIDRQRDGVRLFGVGITLACIVFASVTFGASTFVIGIIESHIAHTMFHRRTGGLSKTTSSRRVVTLHTPAQSGTSSSDDINNTHNNKFSTGSESSMAGPSTRPSFSSGPSLSTNSTTSDAFQTVIMKLRRLRMLVVGCLAGSLAIGAVMISVPAAIEYIFPVSVTNGAILVSVYIAIDSGIPSRSPTRTKRRHQSDMTATGTSDRTTPRHDSSTHSLLPLTSATINMMMNRNHAGDNTLRQSTDSGGFRVETSAPDHTHPTVQDDDAAVYCGPCWFEGEGFMTIYGSSTTTTSATSSSSRMSSRSQSAQGSRSADMMDSMDTTHHSMMVHHNVHSADSITAYGEDSDDVVIHFGK